MCYVYYMAGCERKAKMTRANVESRVKYDGDKNASKCVRFASLLLMIFTRERECEMRER